MAPRKKKFKSDDVSVAQNVAPADDANVDGSVTDDAIHEDCPENFLIEIEENRSAVLKAVKAHRNPSSDFNLESAVAKLSSEELNRLWSSCHLYTTEAVLANIEQNTNDQLDISRTIVDDTSLFIVSVVSLARATVATFKKNQNEVQEVPSGFMETTSVLHEFLPSIQDDVDDGMRNAIAKLCEEWYCKGLPDKDNFTKNTIVYLLSRSLRDTTKVADVKRVYAMHSALVSVNLQSSESENLRKLLFRTAKSSVYLKNNDGIKFVSFLFSLSPSFIVPLHQSIKQIIPGLSKDLSKKLGEIYLKAWTNSAGAFRTRIEDDCIQDLMYHGILANRNLPKSTQLFDPIFNILSKFHAERNCKSTQEAVERLWEPLLWRHLCAANASVRHNSAKFFFDAFPIENPNEELELRAAKQENQIVTMLKLLDDDVPDVRIVAIDGVSTVLSRLWIIMSSQEINRLVKFLVHDLAFDSSSPAVRQAVLKACTYLVVNCPRSHFYLREILPRLSDCLHDVNESVKLAMLDLLLSVKNVKAIQFWNISPLDHLLARLATDKSQKICQKVTQLLFRSFFPIDQLEEVKLERCIRMVEKNREAARMFYLNLEKLTQVQNAVAFSLAILVHLKRFVKRQLQSRAVESSTDQIDESDVEENKENEHNKNTLGRLLKSPTRKVSASGEDKASNETLNSTTNEPESKFDEAFSNPTTVAALLDIVCILLVNRGIEISKPENEKYRILLEKKAAGMLSLLFKFYKSDAICQTIVYACSCLPNLSSSLVSGFCLSRIKNVDPSNEGCSEMPTWCNDKVPMFKTDDPTPVYVDALINWNRSGEILELIENWMRRDIENRQQDLDRSRGIPKRRCVRFVDPADQPRPRLSFTLIKYILRHPVNKPKVLRKNFEQLEELRNVLEVYIPIICDHLDQRVADADDDDQTEVILANAWDVFIKLDLSILLHKISGDLGVDIANVVQLFIEKIERLFMRSLDEILPHLGKSALARYIMMSLLNLTSVLILTDLDSPTFVANTMEVAMRMLETDDDLSVLSSVSHLCKDATKWSAKMVEDANKIIYADIVPDIIGEVLLKLSTIKVGDRSVPELKKNLFSILVAYKSVFDGPLMLERLLKPMMKLTFKDISKTVETTGELPSWSSFKELPYFASFITDVLSNKNSIFIAFLGVWLEEVSGSQFGGSLLEVAGQTALLRTCSKCCQNNSIQNILKSLVAAIEYRLDQLTTDSEENQLEEAAGNALKDAKLNLQMLR